MTQPRYYTQHHDSISWPQRCRPLAATPDQAPQNQHTPTDLRRRSNGLLPERPIAEPGIQAGDVSSLRFLSSRKLRELEVEGPSPMALSINGQQLRTLRPGRNTFEPPIPLEPGDVLQLEVLASDPDATPDPLTGWSSPVTDTHDAGQSR